jgi:hypothetical protein
VCAGSEAIRHSDADREDGFYGPGRRRGAGAQPCPIKPSRIAGHSALQTHRVVLGKAKVSFHIKGEKLRENWKSDCPALTLYKTHRLIPKRIVPSRFGKFMSRPR